MLIISESLKIFVGRSTDVDVAEIWHLHSLEKYVLVWRNGRGCVLLKEGAASNDMLRALWQVIRKL